MFFFLFFLCFSVFFAKRRTGESAGFRCGFCWFFFLGGGGWSCLIEFCFFLGGEGCFFRFGWFCTWFLSFCWLVGGVMFFVSSENGVFSEERQGVFGLWVKKG